MEAEIVVIGSGVAATAVITRILSDRPNTAIIVLEAGNKIKMRDFPLFQNYMVTGKLPSDSKTIYDSVYDLPYPDRDTPGENSCEGDTPIPMNGSRTFMYGGTTAHWGGWAFRLKEEDFRLRSNMERKRVNPGDTIDWPFDYNELESYYNEAEHFIGVSGDSKDTVTPRTKDYPYPAFPYTLEDQLFIDAFNKPSTPITYSHMPIARYGATHSNVSHGPCHTTGLCKYCPFGARFVAGNNLDDLVQSALYPNLRIITNVVVEEILMNSKRTATGVRYWDKNTNTWQECNAKKVIVASGAIEGPKLLQRSKSTFWQEGIGNDNDLVGRFLISHPYYFFKATLKNNPKMLQPEMGFPTLVSRHYDNPDEQAKGKFIMINPPSSPEANLSNLMRSGKTKDQILSSIRNDVNVQLQGIIEVFSERNNRVLNLDKKNRFGLNETLIKFNKSDKFDARMNDILNVAKMVFANMNATDVKQEYPISWRADHAACTTRMSNDPKDGVVDKNLKIHGIDNIYVCSNSSFASLGAVNPTLTLAALSLRLGKHLLSIL